MRSFLQQPYPFCENIYRRLAFCGGIGLFIALFLAIFEPFGFDELSTNSKWKHAALFGIVTFTVSAFFQIVITKIFPRFFREETWKSWKEIVYLLITTAFIGAGNYGLMLFLYPQNTRLVNFLRAELITLQVGIFPICFVVFSKQLTLYRRFAEDAKRVTEDIHADDEKNNPAPTPISQEKIHLRGDNQKEELILSASELLIIASADNYVRVQFLQDGTSKSVLMRSTLKKMEEQLAGDAHFFRCHRMYLVNLRLVTSVTGNAQGLRLHLSGLEEPIPVSRGLTETVKNKLHHLFHSPHNA